MLQLNQSQFDAIEQSFRQQRRNRLARIFTLTYPDLAAQRPPTGDLVQYFDQVIADGHSIEIRDDDQLLECAAIGILIHGVAADTFTLALILRILLNAEASPRERLDFIWNNLLRRPESSA